MENPRVRPDTQKGFVCSVSGAQRNEHGKALGYIYNHRTGQSVNEEDAAVLDLDANEVAITGRRPRWLTHPGRLHKVLAVVKSGWILLISSHRPQGSAHRP